MQKVKRINIIILILLALLLQGCFIKIAGQPYFYTPTENDATIVVFRPWALCAAAHEIGINLDGQTIVGLGTDEYATVRLSPGLHTVDSFREKTSISARPNDRLYIKAEIKCLFQSPTVTLRETDEKDFNARAKKMKEKIVSYKQ